MNVYHPNLLPAKPFQHPRIQNVVIHYGKDRRLAETAKQCIINANIGPVEIFDSHMSWTEAVKVIVGKARCDWAAIWNSDVKDFSPNFNEFLDILTPGVGLASPALFGTPYTHQKPGSRPRITSVPFVDGTSLFINMKTFRPEWLDTRFQWGMDILLGFCVRKAGYSVIVDRGVHYHHIMRASHTPEQIKMAERSFERFKETYKDIWSELGYEQSRT